MTEYFKCCNCGWHGEEADLVEKNIDMEEYYGVGADFQNHNHVSTMCCPKCGEWDELEEYYPSEGDKENAEY